MSEYSGSEIVCSYKRILNYVIDVQNEGIKERQLRARYLFLRAPNLNCRFT